jgi:hypothetical protein
MPANNYIPVQPVGLFVNVPNTVIPIGTDVFITSGYSKTGVGAAHFIATTTTTAAAHRVQTRNGRWFQLAETAPTPQMFGAMGDGVTDDTTAVQNWINYVKNNTVYLGAGEKISGVGRIPVGTYVLTSSINGTIKGDGTQTGFTLIGDDALNCIFTDNLQEAYPVFDFTNCYNTTLDSFQIRSRSTSKSICHILFAQDRNNTFINYRIHMRKIMTNHVSGMTNVVASLVTQNADVSCYDQCNINSIKIGASQGWRLPWQRQGTAQAGSTASTIVLDAGASSVDGFYVGYPIRLCSGTGSAGTSTASISSITWSGGVATVTTATPHNLGGNQTGVSISGVTPSGYNGSVTATVTGSNTFTYSVSSNPGAYTSGGTVSTTWSTYGRPVIGVITGYVGATKTATVDITWPVATPDTTTQFELYSIRSKWYCPQTHCDMTKLNWVNNGTITGQLAYWITGITGSVDLGDTYVAGAGSALDGTYNAAITAAPGSPGVQSPTDPAGAQAIYFRGTRTENQFYDASGNQLYPFYSVMNACGQPISVYSWAHFYSGNSANATAAIFADLNNAGYYNIDLNGQIGADGIPLFNIGGSVTSLAGSCRVNVPGVVTGGIRKFNFDWQVRSWDGIWLPFITTYCKNTARTGIGDVFVPGSLGYVLGSQIGSQIQSLNPVLSSFSNINSMPTTVYRWKFPAYLLQYAGLSRSLQVKIGFTCSNTGTIRFYLRHQSLGSVSFTNQPANNDTVTIGNSAQGSILVFNQPANNDTVTIGSRVYTFVSATPTVDGQVHIGTSANNTSLNLINAINNSGGTPGTDYVVTASDPNVTAAAGDYQTAVLTAKVGGTGGNSIALAKSSANVFISGSTLINGSSKTYTFQTTLTNANGNVHIGATLSATITNLINAINNSGGVSGTDYAASNTTDVNVTAAQGAGNTISLTSIVPGVVANLISLAASSSGSTFSVSGANMTSGIDCYFTFALLVTSGKTTTCDFTISSNFTNNLQSTGFILHNNAVLTQIEGFSFTNFDVTRPFFLDAVSTSQTGTTMNIQAKTFTTLC